MTENNDYNCGLYILEVLTASKVITHMVNKRHCMNPWNNIALSWNENFNAA